ncbi:hypothetical protein QJS10_CPB11g01490 [Acorus calamus]|uniref:PH domain-containing protein n=1 Tax=Acorus calamus TaxID=4465 RepID=A0AAV9DTU2_ACOCL|nr:hypothetical protein QJS10_CPB11g01490 [Acorus calamus]
MASSNGSPELCYRTWKERDFVVIKKTCERKDSLRKWNERWMILDPTTGKMEYKIRRNEPVVKGTIIFDSNSTITMSPILGLHKRRNIFSVQKLLVLQELGATQLVLRAHKEAVNSLGGNGSSKLGTVATVVAAANSTAAEATKEIESAMRISMRAALGLVPNKPNDGQWDDLTVMKFE